jgi:seryl-tRNA synthetase
MLDIKYIREHADEARARLASRGRGDEQGIAEVLRQDERRRFLLVQVETLKADRNKASKEIGIRKGRGEAADDLMARMKEVSDEIARLDAEVAQVEAAQHHLLLTIPNLPHPSVPVGDASANRVERTWGKPAEFAFAPKTHMELGAALGMLDFGQAAKISGSGFIVFRGKGARLERALIQYLLDFHTREAPPEGLVSYTEISPPFLVRGDAMTGTGQLPKFAEDMYKLEGEDLYLIPTAEVPVTNLHREEIVPAERLPIRYAAYTPCFRREAGSAGRDNRGMIRVHQFDKVELVQVVRPEASEQALEQLVGQVEAVLQSLGLHYRVLTLSTGDMSGNAQKCYDLEVWAPALQTWLEVSSCSNFGDYQARRMGLRFKGEDGRNAFCHTLNGSGTALARLFIAVVEAGQQADGRVLLPEKLRPYIGTDFL